MQYCIFDMQNICIDRLSFIVKLPNVNAMFCFMLAIFLLPVWVSNDCLPCRKWVGKSNSCAQDYKLGQTDLMSIAPTTMSS